MMKRRDALAAMRPYLDDAVVIPVYNTAFDWVALAADHRYTLTRLGAMGLASSYGLGLAMAQPTRKVVVLDGDGSAMMNLGSFITIGASVPRNLIHVIIANDAYEANGGHPVPGGGAFRFAEVAKAANYSISASFSDVETLAQEFPTILAADGPIFIELKIALEPSSNISDAEYRALYSLERVKSLRAVLAKTG